MVLASALLVVELAAAEDEDEAAAEEEEAVAVSRVRVPLTPYAAAHSARDWLLGQHTVPLYCEPVQ